MFRLFRRFRFGTVKSRSGKYLLYALGEIILVVIGILIALQVNNWNEERKHKIIREQYVRSLMSDLEQDSIRLFTEINNYSEELVKLQNYTRRLSAPGVTIDTVVQIARFEYLPFFNPSNELNRNTLVTLLSTGDLNLFEEESKSRIIAYNSLQVNEVKILDKNVDILLRGMSDNKLGPSENAMLKGLNVNGPLLDRIWDSYSEDEIIRSTVAHIQSKTVNHLIMRASKQRILEGARNLINHLQKTYPYVYHIQ